MFSSCSQLIGLELSQQFVTLQNDMVHKYRLADRVKVNTHTHTHSQGALQCMSTRRHRRPCFPQQVLHADVLDQNLLLQNADVLVMNNVFEFFLEPEEQVRSVLLGRFKLNQPSCQAANHS